MAITRLDFDRMKREKLLDIIRRVIANPGNAEDVADTIAPDWFPVWRCDPKGDYHIVIGSRK